MTREEAIDCLNGIKIYLQTEHIDEEAIDMAIEALSAEAEPMTEEVREALMRLSMCAREECVICKYKDICNFDFQYEESTKNMNTICDSLMRSKCEVDAKWIPCSERLPSENGQYICTLPFGDNDDNEVYVWALSFHNGRFYDDDDEWGMTFYDDVIAWMPLPKPYKEESEVEE